MFKKFPISLILIVSVFISSVAPFPVSAAFFSIWENKPNENAGEYAVASTISGDYLYTAVNGINNDFSKIKKFNAQSGELIKEIKIPTYKITDIISNGTYLYVSFEFIASIALTQQFSIRSYDLNLNYTDSFPLPLYTKNHKILDYKNFLLIRAGNIGDYESRIIKTDDEINFIPDNNVAYFDISYFDSGNFLFYGTKIVDGFPKNFLEIRKLSDLSLTQSIDLVPYSDFGNLLRVEGASSGLYLSFQTDAGVKKIVKISLQALQRCTDYENNVCVNYEDYKDYASDGSFGSNGVLDLTNEFLPLGSISSIGVGEDYLIVAGHISNFSFSSGLSMKPKVVYIRKNNGYISYAKEYKFQGIFNDILALNKSSYASGFNYYSNKFYSAVVKLGDLSAGDPVRAEHVYNLAGVFSAALRNIGVTGDYNNLINYIKDDATAGKPIKAANFINIENFSDLFAYGCTLKTPGFTFAPNTPIKASYINNFSNFLEENRPKTTSNVLDCDPSKIKEFKSNDNYTWKVPPNTRLVRVEMSGGGGGGGGCAASCEHYGGSGGSGGFWSGLVNVIPDSEIAIYVALGGGGGEPNAKGGQSSAGGGGGGGSSFFSAKPSSNPSLKFRPIYAGGGGGGGGAPASGDYYPGEGGYGGNGGGGGGGAGGYGKGGLFSTILGTIGTVIGTIIGAFVAVAIGFPIPAIPIAGGTAGYYAFSALGDATEKIVYTSDAVPGRGGYSKYGGNGGGGTIYDEKGKDGGGGGQVDGINNTGGGGGISTKNRCNEKDKNGDNNVELCKMGRAGGYYFNSDPNNLIFSSPNTPVFSTPVGGGEGGHKSRSSQYGKDGNNGFVKIYW